jgi:hypothetical protein
MLQELNQTVGMREEIIDDDNKFSPPTLEVGSPLQVPTRFLCKKKSPFFPSFPFPFFPLPSSRS